MRQVLAFLCFTLCISKDSFAEVSADGTSSAKISAAKRSLKVRSAATFHQPQPVQVERSGERSQEKGEQPKEESEEEDFEKQVFGPSFERSGIGSSPALEVVNRSKEKQAGGTFVFDKFGNHMRDNDGSQKSAASYDPGEKMPNFQVVTDRGLLNWTLGAEWTQEDDAGEELLPLAVMVVDFTDPFLDHMITDAESMRDFLSLDPAPNANFLFVFTTHNQSIFRASFLSQLDLLRPEEQSFWRSRVYIANDTLDEMRMQGPLRAAIPDVIDSFPSSRKYVTFWSDGADSGVGLERLDCNFQWSYVQGTNNHSPDNPLTADLVYVPNPCSIPQGTLGRGFALVYAEDLECSKEDAVKHLAASLTNLTGVMVMARQHFKLEVIGQTADPLSGPNPQILATMVNYNEELLKSARNGSVQIIFGYSNSAPGNFIVVDTKGTMHEIGYLINPWLSALGWAAQYWVYRKNLRTTLSQSSSSQPIMHDVVSQGKQVVDLSTFEALRNNRTNALYIDAELSCSGDWNTDCPIWDHVASLTVQCGDTVTNNFGAEEPGGSFSELARYVTPYRLGEGKWTTDITDFAPLLQMGTCVFNVTMPRWSTDAWIWSFSLRARMPLTIPSCPNGCGSGLPFKTAKLFSNNEPVLRQTFNASYNSERLQQISIPAGAKWAHLMAIITGHGQDETGCCEFLPSRHVFTLNNQEFAVEFMEPLSTFGCVQAHRGVEPNGFGAWWLGRNGWCNGQPVNSTLFDVTSVLSSNGSIQATYRGLSWDSSSKQWVEPFATRGYILMSSYLSFYE